MSNPNLAKSEPTEQITNKYLSPVTTNSNPQPSKFIPTTKTTPHTTKTLKPTQELQPIQTHNPFKPKPQTPTQPTAANSSNQKPQPTASKQNPWPTTNELQQAKATTHGNKPKLAKCCLQTLPSLPPPSRLPLPPSQSSFAISFKL